MTTDISALGIWQPQELTSWQKFRRDPTTQTAYWLHARRPRSVHNVNEHAPTHLICISDTHTARPHIPEDGDVLIHAGDLTNTGSFEELQDQLDWLASCPQEHKIVIGGNHDRLLDADFVTKHPERITGDRSPAHLNWHDIIYLENTSTTIKVRTNSITVFGSPYTPDCGTFAFQYPLIRDVWKDKIPAYCDIVMVHTPPRGYLDLEGKGCPHLTAEIFKKRPGLVVFGHIHAGRGTETVSYTRFECKYQEVMTGNTSRWTILSLIFLWLLSWITRTSRVETRLFNVAVNGRDPAYTAIDI